MTEQTPKKVCTRCGRELPETEFYEVKYKGQESKYRYSVCKECTAIEQRRRYLLKNDPENPVLEQINKLYDKHRAAGRSVPDANGGRRRGAEIDNTIEKMLMGE